MNNLHSVLENMLQSLSDLEPILVEELKQLECLSINPVSLQMIVDIKSQLLSRLRYYDELRLTEEENHKIKAPYINDRKLSKIWSNIREIVLKSNALNQKTHILLDMHMNKIRKINSALESNNSELSIYGPQGKQSSASQGKIYNLSI
jgi:flagellar biosynthesis/type III secretory pathway chaperone